MKRMTKKVLVVILALVFTFSLFSGCAKKPADNSGEVQKQSGSVENKQPESTEKKAEEKPLEIKFMTPLFESVPDMNNEWWTELQKKTNTKWTIEWVPSGDYNSKFDLVLASGDIPDVMVGLNQERPTLVSAIKKGAFWDLSSVLGDFSKYPNLKNNPTPGAWDYVKVDGKIWGIPRSRPQIDLGIKIRKDWLDKLGIAIPTTLDEYKDTLKKIVEGDPDGNGQKDTLGLIGYFGGSGNIIRDSDGTFMAAFGALDPVYDAEGGLVHNHLKNEYADFVEYLRGLYAEGLMAKEFGVMKSTQAEEMFTSGRAASYTRNVWRDYSFQEQIKKAQPEAVVETLPPMKGPKGYTAWLGRGIYGAFYISKKVPEDKMLRIMDYFESTCTEEWLNMAYFGVEGVHHTLVDGQRTLSEKGKQQVGTSVQQPVPMIANTWAKVIYAGAPKAYNDAKLKAVEPIGELGKINPFEVLVSDTWTNTWPKYENEFSANTVKAIVGQISMDEYRGYLEKLRNMPEFKQSFKEFAESYKAIFGK